MRLSPSPQRHLRLVEGHFGFHSLCRRQLHRRLCCRYDGDEARPSDHGTRCVLWRSTAQQSSRSGRQHSIHLRTRKPGNRAPRARLLDRGPGPRHYRGNRSCTLATLTLALLYNDWEINRKMRSALIIAWLAVTAVNVALEIVT